MDNPSNTASRNPFSRSSTHVFIVVVLKPNRSSSLNCAYQANGKLAMLNATPVAKRKPAIAKTDEPKAAVNFPNAHGNTPLNKDRDEEHGIKHCDDFSKAALGQSIIDRTAIRRLVNHFAKCRRHFVRMCTHVTLVQPAQPQFSRFRARELEPKQ